MRARNFFFATTNSIFTYKKLKYCSLILMLIIGFSFFVLRTDFSYSGSSSVQNSKIMQLHGLTSYKSSSTMSTLTNSPYGLGFSTYIGGSGDDNLNAITVDSSGNIYMAGYTNSSNFPMKNAYNSTYGGDNSGNPFFGDGIIVKFNSTGYLLFSTFLGGSSDDPIEGIAVDNNGNIYVTGWTTSSNFPTKNAYQPAYKSNDDCFLTKFDSTGALLFSTFFGGNNADVCFAIAVDTHGNSYITGHTKSTDLLTKNAYNATYGGGTNLGDAFVAKFDPLGALIFSTYLGGSGDDTGNAIAVDTAGNSYVTGETNSNNFPTKNAYSVSNGGSNDVFLTEFNTTGTLVSSTYLGGNSDEYGQGIAVDSTGNSYISGYTSSNNFPTKNAYNSTYSGTGDAFIAKFFANHTLDFSTYVGGNGDDMGYSIAVDSAGNSYVSGWTSSNNFPMKNAYNSTYGTNYDAFVVMLNKTGTLVFSTYLGGTKSDYGEGIGIDSNGNIYTCGYTDSSNFVTKNAYYPRNSGEGDIFLTKFSNPFAPLVSTSSSATTSTGSSSTLITSTGPSSTSLFDLTLLTNPLFDVVSIIAIFAVILDLVLIIKRRK